MYSDKVMDHFSNPRNAGVIDDADGIGEVGNPVCGDMMTFYIKVKDDRLEDVKFNTFGCVAAIAVSSMVSEMAKGRPLDEAIMRSAMTWWLKRWADYQSAKCTVPIWVRKPWDWPSKITRKDGGKRSEPGTKGEAGRRRNVCTRCDMENPDNASFCIDCGEKLACASIDGHG